jgi:hypothetical protein
MRRGPRLAGGGLVPGNGEARRVRRAEAWEARRGAARRGVAGDRDGLNHVAARGRVEKRCGVRMASGRSVLDQDDSVPLLKGIVVAVVGRWCPLWLCLKEREINRMAAADGVLRGAKPVDQ